MSAKVKLPLAPKDYDADDQAQMRRLLELNDELTIKKNSRSKLRSIATDAVTVANLPPNPIIGERSFVTNATATTYASVVAGGGANKVPVVFNGTAWIIG